MKDWKTQFIQPEYLRLSDLLVPWSAELAFFSYSTCNYPLYTVTTSLLLFRTFVSLSEKCSSLGNHGLICCVYSLGCSYSVVDHGGQWDQTPFGAIRLAMPLCLLPKEAWVHGRMTQTQLLSHLTARTQLWHTSVCENCLYDSSKPSAPCQWWSQRSACGNQ